MERDKNRILTTYVHVRLLKNSESGYMHPDSIKQIIFMRTKTLLLFVVAAMTLLTACKKDDEKTNAEKIIGKWTLVTSVTSGKYQGAQFEQKDTGTSADYTEFKADGTWASSESGDTASGTYSINGDQLIMKMDGETVADTYSIKQVTDNSLVIYAKGYEYTDANNYIDMTVTFKR